MISLEMCNSQNIAAHSKDGLGAGNNYVRNRPGADWQPRWARAPPSGSVDRAQEAPVCQRAQIGEWIRNGVPLCVLVGVSSPPKALGKSRSDGHAAYTCMHGWPSDCLHARTLHAVVGRSASGSDT